MAGADYGYQKQLGSVSFEEAVTRVSDALKQEGFGVLTEIDVQATLKKKLGVDMPRYTILGACNPKLAHRALGVEPEIGLLLPCNVVVREVDQGTEVSVANPRAMFSVVKATELEPVAQEADERLSRVIAAL
jgi:uncharacterized protein (DUF302 family)